MIQIKNPENCCGCTACETICPQNAISMTPDMLGFLYPEVDKNKCIDCGLCGKTCAFNTHHHKDDGMDTPPYWVYAARHKDMKEVLSSQSGAMFVALSDWVLRNGGIVYGAGYTSDFRVIHKRATTRQERDELRGSKYVQSDMNTIFKQVKQDMDNGLNVLFSGTPCQTAGLRQLLTILGTDLTNLYICDIVCHGVPAPYCWRDYLTYIENKYKRKIIKTNFRDKSFGWNKHKESFTFDDTYTYTYTYTYLFYTSIMIRRSCGVCPFTDFKRPSDITIGDFWEYWGGTNRIYKAFHSDNKGISLVLLNTDKGIRLFNLIKDTIEYVESNMSECLQPNLQHPTPIPSNRTEFEKDYQTHDYEYIITKYGDFSLKARLRHRKDLIIRKLKIILNGMKK